MMLQFPTGSLSRFKKSDIIASMHFMYDSSWKIKTHPRIPEDALERVQEFVAFIVFAAGREDFVLEFIKFKDDKEKESYDDWRRATFKLIKGDLE